MNPILSLQNVSKHYPKFDLEHVSFDVQPGHIMGYIGRNGAGKTTTLKAIYGLIGIDEGQILIDGEPLHRDERHMKDDIGILFGGVDMHPNSKVAVLTKVTSRFYSHWNQKLYEQWIRYFGIDESKKIKELSNGMKVKYLLALALSHQAKLLLLDEPTSGLDPVSRDELLDSLRRIAQKKGTSIVFSTHVISDLEKIADDVTYIREGKIVASSPIETFKKGYLPVEAEEALLTPERDSVLLHLRKRLGKFEGTIQAKDASLFPLEALKEAGLEEIMLAIERGQEDEESPL